MAPHLCLSPFAEDSLKGIKSLPIVQTFLAGLVNAAAETSKDLHLLRERATSLESSQKALRDENDILKGRLQRAEDEVASLKRRVGQLSDSLKKKKNTNFDIAAYYSLLSRVEVMKEFKEGKTDEWNPDADMKLFEEQWGGADPAALFGGGEDEEMLDDACSGDKGEAKEQAGESKGGAEVQEEAPQN